MSTRDAAVGAASHQHLLGSCTL